MLFALTGLIGCPVEGSDGRVGGVKDFLFDDKSWKVRWMVVDTGHWLPGRQILIHPSAIAPLDAALHEKRALPMISSGETLTLSVDLSRRQIEESPDASEEEPCTAQMETRLYQYYGWDPDWGATHIRASITEAADGDPYLRSVATVKGYRVHATDGDLGHVEHFLADDADWDIRYLVIATRNWLPGKHVQLAPYAVTKIETADRSVKLNVTRDQVKSSPAWDPLTMADEVAEQAYHRHFGWPGYGW